MKKVLLALAALCLAASLCGCGYSEEDLSNARSEGYKEGYSDGQSSGYEKGKEYGEWIGREDMMDILWEEGESAVYVRADFCCPNCRTALCFKTEEGVTVEAYPGTRDYPGYYEYYDFMIEYDY